MVKNLAIIPARSGSKRIKDKNITSFVGIPLIAHTIEAAKESGLFSDIIVSTDNIKYAEIAEHYGAKVPFLRKNFVDDYSSLADVLSDVILRLENNNLYYDNFALLQPTCPLRNALIINEVYEFFVKNNFNTVLTCFQLGFMNPWWSFKLHNDEAEFLLSSPVKTRSQDNEKLYCPSGAIGFAKVNEYKKDPGFYGKNHKFYPIDWKYAIDIDNIEDLELAEAVYYMLHKEDNV